MSRSAMPGTIRRLHGLLAAQRGQQTSDEQLLHAFLSRRDESAFAALVRRHGPMVLHVCRRVLGHQQDAEDAFQATFLVLARNAATLRKRTALASFLHGIASRIALKAKQAAARRRKHEGRTPHAERDDYDNPADALSWGEVRTLLDEEIAHLPEIYRSVFVLCCLESVSREETARRLGLKEGTVSSRLAEARKQLQQRLARRGVELTAVPAAATLAAPSASALPPALLAQTIRAALATVAAGTVRASASVVSPAVAALANNGPSIVGSAKVPLAIALLLAASVLVGAGALVQFRPAAESGTPPATEKAKPAAPAQSAAKDEHKGDIAVAGRVLDPDGKPVSGARLVFVCASTEKVPEKVWATSAAGGGFHFWVARSIENAAWSGDAWDHTYIVAAARGHGFACTRLRPETAGDLTLRLVKDDVPIRGRILDLQGKPVAGATVRVVDELLMPAVLFPPVQTGADGRFQINGIGRDRVATLRVEGPTIATQRAQAVARPTDKAGAAPRGVPFDLLAVPTRPVIGVVRDKDTGKPLAGVVVRSCKIGGADDFNGLVRTTTDKEGRYRLVGLPKGANNAIIAETRGWWPRFGDRPYFAAIRKVDDTPGLEPVTIDVALKRGVWVEGRVIDKATGKMVPAGLEYFCFTDNPLADELPPPRGVPGEWTRRDGSFRTVALPGRGLIAVRADRDHYRMGVGADRIKGPRTGADDVLFSTYPYHLYPENFHTIVEVSPKPGDESVRCDVVLDSGRTLQGTVVGPDGQPLAGARVAGLRPLGYWEHEPLKGAEFTVWGLTPGQPRMLQMIHDGKKLSGWRKVAGDEKGPLRVRLQAWGSVRGRLVRPDRQPMTNVSIGFGSLPPVPVGADGRFRIDGLAAGLKYNPSVVKEANYGLEIIGGEVKDLTIKPGETKDLGDLVVKPME